MLNRALCFVVRAEFTGCYLHRFVVAWCLLAVFPARTLPSVPPPIPPVLFVLAVDVYFLFIFLRIAYSGTHKG